MSNETYEQQLIQFKELQSKSQKVSEGAFRVNAQIENSQENYRKLVEVADKKFETHNVDELMEMLQKWQMENATRLANYADALNKKVAEVEEKTRLIKQIQQS